MREAFALGGARVAPGTRATVDLPVSVLSDHTPVTLSVQVVHGRRPGPVAFVSSGVHGDEVIGTEIVRRLLRAPALKGLRGTLLAVPIVNAFGFLNRSRYLPDRRDLNRSFPGSAGGSLAARLANLFLTEVVGPSEFGIDLHSAAVHRTNLPQTRVSPGASRAAGMARAFGAPVILTSPLREGSLRGAAAEKGVEVLLYEAGEGLRFDEMAIRAGLAGILRVLHAEGMLTGRPVAAPRRPPVPCRASRWLRAPIGGLLRTFRAEGDEVAAGDLLAAVADPFGEVEAEIRAPEAGILVGRAVLPVVNEGDAVFHLAFPAAPEDAEGAVGALRDQLAAEPLFDEDEII
ncbi:MAG: succinylglutamate desuccinylase/aspartoacylase family protein [Hasllibacter sp.]